MKGHFSALDETSDEPGVNEARGYACEFVAWQFLTNLKESEIIEYLLVELPPASASSSSSMESGYQGRQNGRSNAEPNERSPLLPTSNGDYFNHGGSQLTRFGSLMSQCENLSALELATVSGMLLTVLSSWKIRQRLNHCRSEEIPFPETGPKNHQWLVERRYRLLGDP